MAKPYGGTASVDDVGVTFDCLSAYYVNIANRLSSDKSFDISYDGGATYITRLEPGQATNIGWFDASVQIGNLTLKCSDSGGTATAEITCLSGGI